MRRKLPLAVIASAALALGVGAGVRADDDAPEPVRAAATDARALPVAHHDGARGPHGMVARLVLGSLAGRLDVETSALREALREVAGEEARRAARRAGLSRAQRELLRSCHTDRRDCDRGAARRALRRLKAAGLPDLADAKERVAGRLAQELGVDERRLLDAARAELVQRLGQGEALGMVSARTRRTALRCFDAPASCDVAALRRALKAQMHRRHP